VLARPIRARVAYRLTVDGLRFGGRGFDGDLDGRPGGSYVAEVRALRLVPRGDHGMADLRR
jgi:hypothetical protein